MSQTSLSSLIILKSVPSRSSTGITVIGNMRRHRDIMNFVILCYLVNSSNCPNYISFPHVTWMRIPWLFPMLWSSNASVLGSPAKMTIRRTLRWIWIRNGRHQDMDSLKGSDGGLSPEDDVTVTRHTAYDHPLQWV